MEELRQKIWGILETYTGHFGLVIMNQATGVRLELNPTLPFPAASMIKVPIMYEIMRQAAAKKLSLEDTLIVTKEVCVDGAGILKELRPNIPMTVKELMTLMIIVSDNTATNMLIDHVGMKAVNGTMSALGLTATCLKRHMMDFAAAQSGRENMISAADLTLLYSKLLTGNELPETYNHLMLDILKRQQIRDKLPFYWPEETVLAHKTGTLSGVEHDGGILFFPGGPYIVVVLTSNLEANYRGLQLVAEIGQVLYDALNPMGL
ncbi:serine hydrolase [bacterium BFN5]|nr:serine hydrolase [bacterium BFN5]